MKKKQENLEKIIESLEEKVHNIVSEDREGQFLVDNKGKEVILFLNNGKEITGELLDIDRNRIEIQVDSSEFYYYKHAVIGYQPKK